MTPWIVVLAVGIGTYVLRASMFVLLRDRVLPTWLDRPMGVVAPAAVAALVGSMLFTANGRIDPVAGPELLAVAAGFVAVRRSGNVMHAFAVGLPVMWTLSAMF